MYQREVNVDMLNAVLTCLRTAALSTPERAGVLCACENGKYRNEGKYH